MEFPDTFTFNSLILSHCKMNEMNSARSLLECMLKLGAAPDIYTYNAFIKCWCTNDRVDEALGLLSTLKGNECTPNEYTYSLLTEALLLAGRSQEANELIRDCKKSNNGYWFEITEQLILLSSRELCQCIWNHVVENNAFNVWDMPLQVYNLTISYFHIFIFCYGD